MPAGVITPGTNPSSEHVLVGAEPTGQCRERASALSCEPCGIAAICWSVLLLVRRMENQGMAKRVFFSFYYQDVVDFRANVVRQHWLTKPDREAAGFFDASIWGNAKLSGDVGIRASSTQVGRSNRDVCPRRL